MTPSGASSLAALGEIFVEMAYADMLEHADRDDAVERPGEGAVVAQLEAGVVGEAALARAPVRDAVLLGREGDAGDVDVRHFGHVEAEAAPAGADVEQRLAGLEPELGGEVALLGELRRFEVAVGRLEVGAGVLAVGIEEQPVEAAVEVVVVGDVLARAAEGVVLAQAAREVADAVDRLHPPGRAGGAEILEQDGEEIVDRALLDDEAAVHERLAELEVGVQDHAPLGRQIGEAGDDRIAAAVAEPVPLAGTVDDLELSALDPAREDHLKQAIHRDTPTHDRIEALQRRMLVAFFNVLKSADEGFHRREIGLWNRRREAERKRARRSARRPLKAGGVRRRRRLAVSRLSSSTASSTSASPSVSSSSGSNSKPASRWVRSSPRDWRCASSAERATLRLTVAATSGWSAMRTEWMPMVLIGRLRSTWLRATLKPFADTASEMSRAATEP